LVSEVNINRVFNHGKNIVGFYFLSHLDANLKWLVARCGAITRQENFVKKIKEHLYLVSLTNYICLGDFAAQARSVA